MLIANLICALPLLAAPSQLPPAAGAGNARVREHFGKAAAALKENNPTAAVKEFNAVLALDPKNKEALTDRGALLFLQGDCHGASQDFRSVLALDHAVVKASAMLGICEKRLGGSSALHLLAESFPKLSDGSLRLQVGLELADAYFRESQPERATPVVQSLMNSYPDNVDVLYFAHLLYSELADDTLNKLAVVGTNSARMEQVIAERLVNAGDVTGAIAHYRRCLEIDPHLRGVRFELAEAILQSSPTDPATQAAAKKEFEAVISTEGDNAKIESALGAIARRESDVDSAGKYYARAVALNPRDVDAEIGISRVLMSKDQPREAVKYLRGAIESDPLNAEAHYRLALAYRRLQMDDDARRESELFQQIKKKKEEVKALYQQMGKHTSTRDEQLPEIGR